MSGITERLEHGRKVALKVLRPESAAVLGAERVQRRAVDLLLEDRGEGR